MTLIERLREPGDKVFSTREKAQIADRIEALEAALREAREAMELGYEGRCRLGLVPEVIAKINEVLK